MKIIHLDSFPLRNTFGREMKLDKLLAEHGLSIKARIDAFKQDAILFNGKVATRNQKIPDGGTVEVLLLDESNDFVHWDKPLRILYEDGHMLALYKEEGIPMMPEQGEESGALANQLAHYYAMTGQKRKIRFVNRLDMDTSGIVLVAKHKYMQKKLQEQMEANTTEKLYLAVVTGVMENTEGVFTEGIAKTGDALKRKASILGKDSRTAYRVLKKENGLSLLELTLETGRTHQIRVHLSHAGHPILGDTLYDGGIAKRLYLHGYKYTFENWDGRRMSVTSIPKDWPIAISLK